MSNKYFYVYMVRCSDNTLYTGYSDDVLNRVKTHNKGNGAKYTKCRLPVHLVYMESFSSKSEAMSREWYIKHRLSRKDKEDLIRSSMNEV
jgi:putative endonuclease